MWPRLASLALPSTSEAYVECIAGTESNLRVKLLDPQLWQYVCHRRVRMAMVCPSRDNRDLVIDLPIFSHLAALQASATVVHNRTAGTPYPDLRHCDLVRSIPI